MSIFVQNFSEIYLEMQVIPHDSRDMKQNCPVCSTLCRTFQPCMEPLELYSVFDFIVRSLTMITQKVLLKSVLEERHMTDELIHCTNPLKWLQKNYIRD